MPLPKPIRAFAAKSSAIAAATLPTITQIFWIVSPGCTAPIATSARKKPYKHCG
jgi:hypothetical protein